MNDELKRYIASLYTTLRIAQETINTLTLSVNAMRDAAKAIPEFEARYTVELAAQQNSSLAQAQSFALAVIDAQIASLGPDHTQN
jgi:hypothetical protein